MDNNGKLGALWKPNSDNPNAPIAKGNIEIDGLKKKIQIVVWRNKNKKDGEKTPDFYINLDTPREPGQTPPPKPQADDSEPPF